MCLMESNYRGVENFATPVYGALTFKSNIDRVLSGFDRLIFHGGIRSLMYEVGMAAHLYSRGVYLKDFKDYAPHCSQSLKRKPKNIV